MGKTEEKGEIREPVIVVSDVHLGGAESNFREFWDFLDWLTTLPAEGKALKCNATELTIKKPGTIVLLGDILELWDPEDDDRNYALTDVLAPISILSNLGCDIIYVIGNHDEDLLDFKKAWRKKNAEFPPKGSFEIVYRSYPRRKAGTKIIKGVPIGENTYVFLHGQQFDRFQVFYRISKFLSELLNRQVRIDPIDWHQDLSNVSFTKNVGRKPWNTSIFGLLFVLYILGYFFWVKDTQIGSGWGIFWVIISAFFVVTILPKVVTWLNTEIWRRIPGTIVKKCTPVEEVIKNRYADKKGKYIDTDTFVFGHTHNAGGYYMKEKKRLFINTGCWVSECADEKRNAFLYLDTAASCLLKWDKEKVATGEITCLEDFRELLR